MQFTVVMKFDPTQEPITRSLHLHLARIFLFLEQFSPQPSLNSQESILYSASIVLCFVELCFAVLYYIVLYHGLLTVWNILCANLRTPQFLQIERYAQRLSHRVCMGDGGSG